MPREAGCLSFFPNFDFSSSFVKNSGLAAHSLSKPSVAFEVIVTDMDILSIEVIMMESKKEHLSLIARP